MGEQQADTSVSDGAGVLITIRRGVHTACACMNGVYDFFKPWAVTAYSYIKYVLPFLFVYSLHIGSTHLYASLCANLSIIGFMNSIFLIGSPICSMILQIVTSTNTAFVAIISGMCIYIITKVPRS